MKPKNTLVRVRFPLYKRGASDGHYGRRKGSIPFVFTNQQNKSK